MTLLWHVLTQTVLLFCAVSVWENLGLPIRFIGVGEKLDDLMEFDAQTFVESLLPESALQKDEKKEEGESEA